MVDRIKRLLRWLPVVWNDEDWDHYFLLKILHTKLDTMVRFWGSDKTNIARSDEVLREVTKARDAAKRLIENEYLIEEWGYHEALFGDYELVLEREDGRCLYKGVKYDRDFGMPEEVEILSSRLSELASLREQRDWELLWNILRDKGQGWWD